MAWLKALHISALLVWVGGLLYLPGVLIGHRLSGDGQDFVRVRRAARFAYNAVTSPAAFVAVGSGTALLFVADALHTWMFLKLLFVGGLALHAAVGALLAAYAWWRTRRGFISAARSVDVRTLLIWQAYTAATGALVLVLLHGPAWSAG